jgi:O-antigen/teichoic acid export membrane protein
MRRGRRLTAFSNLIFQYLSIIVAFGSGILLVPLYLKYIPIDLYGAWIASGNILAWLSTIDTGISQALQQKIGVAYAQGDYKSIHGVILGGILISGASAVIVLIVGFMVQDFLPVWLNLSSTLDSQLIIRSFYWMVAATALTIFGYSVTAIALGLQSRIGVNLVWQIVTILSIGLTVWLLFSGYGLLAIPISALFRSLGYLFGNTCYLLWRLKHDRIGFSFNLDETPVLLKLGVVTFFAQTGDVLISNVDSFITARFLGVGLVPLLSLTKRMPEQSRMFVDRVPAAFAPSIAHVIGTGEMDKARVVLLRLSRILLWIMMLMMGGLIAFNGNFLGLWVGAEFYAGHFINLVICIAVALGISVNSLSTFCTALGDIKTNNLIKILQSIIFIPFILLGAANFGMLGIVFAPIGAILCTSLWYFPYSFARLLKFSGVEKKNLVGEILKLLIVIIILSFVFVGWQIESWGIFFVVVLGYIFCYILALSLISPDFRVEINNLRYSFLRHT